MSPDWPLYVSLFLALWSAVIGGVFSAFSEFVMAGLLRAAPAGGIESMQHINRTVLRTQFVAGILLIPPISIGVAVYAALNLDGLAMSALILAALVYTLGVLLVTVFGNVPMNNKLDRLDHNTAEAEAYWRRYGRVWTRLNHVRTIASILTAIIYGIAATELLSTAQI